MRLERGQRLYDVRTLLGYETRGLRWITFSRRLFRFALSDFLIVASFRVLGCGDLDLSRFDAWLDEGDVAGDGTVGPRAVIVPIARTRARVCFSSWIALLFN